jgi:hypothetical protein
MPKYEILVDKIMYKPSHEEIAFRMFLDNSWQLPCKIHAELIKNAFILSDISINPFYVKNRENPQDVIHQYFELSQLRRVMLGYDCFIPLRKFEKWEKPTKEMVYFESTGYNTYVRNHDKLVVKIDELITIYNESP